MMSSFPKENKIDSQSTQNQRYGANHIDQAGSARSAQEIHKTSSLVSLVIPYPYQPFTISRDSKHLRGGRG